MSILKVVLVLREQGGEELFERMLERTYPPNWTFLGREYWATYRAVPTTVFACQLDSHIPIRGIPDWEDVIYVPDYERELLDAVKKIVKER